MIPLTERKLLYQILGGEKSTKIRRQFETWVPDAMKKRQLVILVRNLNTIFMEKIEMTKKLRTLVLLSLAVILVVSACSSPTPEPTQPVAQPTEPMAQPTEPMPEPTEPVVQPTAPVVQPDAVLRIWADDTRTPILLGLADAFLAEYNVQLIVEDLGLVQDIRSQVIIAIPAGEGPDIFIGVHDWLGALVESGLVAPIDLGAKRGEFVESTLDAFTYTDGNLYGVPYASENLGFFYNTEYVTEPPTTWDEVLEIGRTLKAEGKVQYAIAIGGDPGYNSLPMQTAFGGYVFGQDASGAWNPNDVGLDSEGMIDAVTWMVAAVEEGLMPATTDYETGHSLFEDGQTAFLMAGPWALDRIIASGVPYAVTTFPDDGAPFLGVQGFMINPFSDNVLLAEAFLTEYIATEELMQLLYEVGNRPSAYLSVLATTDDPDLAAMGEAGMNAIPMPNIPEMGSVWSAWNNGIILALNGQQPPAESMRDAADQVRDLIMGALAGMVNIPGSYQSLAGCGADWDPACAATAMEEGDDGLFRLSVELPAGDYEFKVALNGDWTVNYGSDGAQDGPNYQLSLDADSTVNFVYDPETNLLDITTE
jgi:arabinogalactan oligomer / maltooligosaccharide transport system substrate-binding protein